MLRFLCTYLLVFIFVSPASLNAQQQGQRSVLTDQIVLERQGGQFQADGMISVPLDDKTPFFTLAMKFFLEDAVHLQIEIAYSEDGRRFSNYKSIGFEEHGPVSENFKVSELVFLGENVKAVRYRITSNVELNIPIEHHFFRPVEEYTLEVNELPLPAARTGCVLPGYVTRTGWSCPDGQDYSSGSPSFTNVSHLVVHHSAGVNTSSNWAAVVLSIWNYHRFTNGWADIGYNFLIDPNGVIYEGRGGNDGYALDVLPAATCGSNSGTMAVCLLGNFETVSPQADAVLNLESLLAWKSEDRSIDPTGSSSLNNYGIIDHVFGHRQGCATACPGQNLYDMLPAVRLGVAEEVVQMCNTEPEHVVYVSHTIDDNNDGESTGDDDGVVESGETIEIFLTLKNIGGDVAYNVEADISADEPCVSFIDANITFGDIEAGQEITNGDYDIVFSPTCEDQIIAFPLTISSNDTIRYDTIYIEVFNNCRPVAIIEADTVIGAVPLTVNFTSQSINADQVAWAFPGGSPAAASSETAEVTYSSPGTYTAILTAFNECGSSDTSQIIVADLVSATFEDKIEPMFYPNPVSNLLHIDLQRFVEEGSYEIINTAGAQVMRQQFSGTSLTITMDHLSSGLYIIQVMDLQHNSTWTRKVEKD